MAFKKNRVQESLLKAPKAEGEQDKKKKKQAATTLQFGAGTRKLFDYLLLILGEQDSELSFEVFEKTLHYLFTTEFEGVLDDEWCDVEATTLALLQDRFDMSEWVANEFIQAFFAGKLQLSLDNADIYCIIKA